MSVRVVCVRLKVHMRTHQILHVREVCEASVVASQSSLLCLNPVSPIDHLYSI